MTIPQLQELAKRYGCHVEMTNMPYKPTAIIKSPNGERKLEMLQGDFMFAKPQEIIPILERVSGKVKYPANRSGDLTPHALYVLEDPRNATVRYVGISKDVERRYRQHIQCNGKNAFKNAWIQELQQQGLQPTCYIICILPGSYEARQAESDLVWDYILKGVSLFNYEDPFMPPEFRGM